MLVAGDESDDDKDDEDATQHADQAQGPARVLQAGRDQVQTHRPLTCRSTLLGKMQVSR